MDSGYYLLVIVALLTTGLAFYYYLQIVALLFQDKGHESEKPSWSRSALSLLGISSFGLLLLAFFPDTLLKFMR